MSILMDISEKISKNVQRELLFEIYEGNSIFYIGNFDLIHSGHYNSYLYLQENFKDSKIYFIHFNDDIINHTAFCNEMIKRVFKNSLLEVFPYSKLKSMTSNGSLFVYDIDTSNMMSENFHIKIPNDVNNIRTWDVKKKIFSPSLTLEQKIEKFKETYSESSLNLFYSILPIMEKSVIGEWMSTNKFEILESSVASGVGADDGPLFLYRDYDIYKKSSPKKLQKFLNTGWNIVKYMVDDDKEIKQDYDEYPNGPVPSVSFYPAGDVTLDQYATAHNQDNFTGNKAYQLWKSHVLKIISSLGWEWVNKVEDKEDIIDQTSDKV